MIDELNQLLESAKGELSQALDEAAVEAARIKFLGKKGSLSGVLRGMGKLAAEERPKVGEIANQVKAAIEALLDGAKQAANDRKLLSDLNREKPDVTLPATPRRRGHRHPVSQAMDDIAEIFARLGFKVASGPEIEWDLYNFEMLAIPPDHPARDMQDTFYIDDKTAPLPPPGSPPTVGKQTLLLRTHTSPVQARTMLSQPPPIRIIAPGKVYRCDSDATHTPMFHQVECLHVEEGLSMAHLRGTLDAFMKAFFGPDTKTRLRPSYFPFTEPSAEVDVSHFLCGGKGCRLCKGTGWLEVLGSGMVNPDVLRMAGFDPEKVTGYAFGVGIDRLAMLRHGIDDLRALFENDVRFLGQL
ncbi:MAG: phenylalanine--tRNA ligase subunit alpha [Deltaproteobacteria bacterium]|nr:phenylalanine--tRNA ligase subunit alpha [Deltaproteobacteria bacterium]